MNAVMASIRPQYCELIVNGKKTLEVRKTRPKLETPFKCYIYCTKEKIPFLLPTYSSGKITDSDIWKVGNGKVIGEFVCDYVKMEAVGYINHVAGYHGLEAGTFLTAEQLMEYGKWALLYGWHISALQIYDKLKELSEFYRVTREMDVCANSTHCEVCEHWRYVRVNSEEYDMDCDCGGPLFKQTKPMVRPPQSWCYVEGLV